MECRGPGKLNLRGFTFARVNLSRLGKSFGFNSYDSPSIGWRRQETSSGKLSASMELNIPFSLRFPLMPAVSLGTFPRLLR